MRRIAFRVMYDGTDFVGWQRQPNGRSVQEELERMLGRIAGDVAVTVTGAGRTDSGVHAHGQAAHADIATRYDDADLMHALQRMAPADVAVYDLRTVPEAFHARYTACARSYRYTIIERADPFLARYAWRIDRPLDPDRLNAAAALALGRHDFTSLSKHNPDTPNSVCDIATAVWSARANGVVFEITADRFLYGMVRLLVGLHVDVERGRRSLDEAAGILAARDRNLQSASAPAAGLSLVDVLYPEEFAFGAQRRAV